MKGDFSRIRFNPAKQYTSVLKQQGRVDVDADANEQRFIDETLRETINVDVIGPFGGPEDNAGFAIKIENNSTIWIGRGRYYVDGILVENKHAIKYDDQPYLLEAPSSSDLLDQLMNASSNATLGFVLEVWQRLVTSLDDPCLIEPALGQADTTARLQTVWRVVGTVDDPGADQATTGILHPITDTTAKTEHYSKINYSGGITHGPVSGQAGTSGSTPTQTTTGTSSEINVGVFVNTSNTSAAIAELSPCCQLMYRDRSKYLIAGQMGASLNQSGNECGCQPVAAAGYQGLENQLYRVEIHQGGDLSTATFKWSRENASVVAAVTSVGTNSPTITVSSLGPDANLGFQAGQWVELTDDTYQFGETPNQPGPLFQIQSVTPTTLQVTMTTPVYGIDVTQNARIRRWDQTGASETSKGIPVSATPVPLEYGIEVDFRGKNFHPGDYWTFAARTANGEIDWPPCGSSGQHFQSASSTQVHHAPLACVRTRDYLYAFKGRVNSQQEGRFVVSDCRLFFSPLTAVNAATAASALHVKAVTWTNDDIMTVDTLLQKGLAVTFDQATTCPWGGGNFEVKLEPAFGPGSALAVSDKELLSFKNALTVSAGTDSILRTVVALDPPQGITVSGNTVTWLASVTAASNANKVAEAVWFMFNILLNAKAPIGFARLRIRLIGGAVYGSNAQGNIYLDGQSLGTTGTRSADKGQAVNYLLPSGTAMKASDYEGWLYLAPTVLITNVVIQGVNNGNTIAIKALKVIVDGNNNITSLQIGETATVTNLQAQITLSYPPVSDTVVTLMFTGAGAGTVVTIASTITIPAGQKTATTPINVITNPGGGVTDTVTLVASVATAVMTLPAETQPTLAITGMTPPTIIK